MNTKLHYMYRDASNWKRWGAVVFRDDPRQDLVVQLEENLLDGEFFVAHQVKLPELFSWLDEEPSEDDHVLHEFASVEPTWDPPTDPRTFVDFVDEISRANEDGWMWMWEPGEERP